MNQSHQINYGRTDWEIIYSHVIMKKNPNSIAKEYKVSNAHVRLLINTFKRNLIMKSKWNRRLLNKKKRLNKVHLEFLKEVIWTISSTPYKISNLKSKLEQNFEDLKGISDSTLRRDLRKSLNMRFKKTGYCKSKQYYSWEFWFNDSIRCIITSAIKLRHWNHIHRWV